MARAVTDKQKKVLEHVGKGKSVSHAMREAGYSEGYAKNPQSFKRTKTFREILKQDIPDELVSKVTKKLTTYKEPFTFEFPASYTQEDVVIAMRKKGARKSDYYMKFVEEKGKKYWRVDGSVLSGNVAPKGVDLVMKGQGLYAPEKLAFTDTAGEDLRLEDIDKEIEELEKQLRVDFIRDVRSKVGKETSHKGKTVPTQKAKA